MERKIIKSEQKQAFKLLKNDKMFHKNKIKSQTLPTLFNIPSQNEIIYPTTLQMENKQLEQEKFFHRHLISKRNEKKLEKIKILKEKQAHYFEKEKNNSKNLLKHEIIEYIEPKVKRNVGYVNYMNKKKLNKYSTFSKDLKNNNNNIYNNNQGLTEEDLNKGMFNLINKGLIPKFADFTPAFNRNGNPLSVNKNDGGNISSLGGLGSNRQSSRTLREIEQASIIPSAKYSIKQVNS